MELVTELKGRTERPPLAAARLRRQLTVERAAKLARLTPDEVSWLEEGRLYRFDSSESAVTALLLYSTALGVSRREARQLAGLPVLPRPTLTDAKSKTAFGVGLSVVVATVAAALLLPGLVRGSSPEQVGASQAESQTGSARRPTASSASRVPIGSTTRRRRSISTQEASGSPSGLPTSSKYQRSRYLVAVTRNAWSSSSARRVFRALGAGPRGAPSSPAASARRPGAHSA